MTLAHRLKQLRLERNASQGERGPSQAELSRQLAHEGIVLSQVAISQLEGGVIKGTTVCASLANFFGVNALWLETGRGKKDLDYVQPQRKEYCKEIEEVIQLMESTDVRGRERALLAVKDAVDSRNAFLASLPLPRSQGVVETTELSHDQKLIIEGAKAALLVEGLMPEIMEDVRAFENEKRTNDGCVVERDTEARKDKRQ